MIVEFDLDAVEARSNFTLHFIEPPVDIAEPSVHRIERLIIDPDRNQDREHDGQRGLHKRAVEDGRIHPLLYYVSVAGVMKSASGASIS